MFGLWIFELACLAPWPSSRLEDGSNFCSKRIDHAAEIVETSVTENRSGVIALMWFLRKAGLRRSTTHKLGTNVTYRSGCVVRCVAVQGPVQHWMQSAVWWQNATWHWYHQQVTVWTLVFWRHNAVSPHAGKTGCEVALWLWTGKTLSRPNTLQEEDLQSRAQYMYLCVYPLQKTRQLHVQTPRIFCKMIPWNPIHIKEIFAKSFVCPLRTLLHFSMPESFDLTKVNQPWDQKETRKKVKPSFLVPGWTARQTRIATKFWRAWIHFLLLARKMTMNFRKPRFKNTGWRQLEGLNSVTFQKQVPFDHWNSSVELRAFKTQEHVGLKQTLNTVVACAAVGLMSQNSGLRLTVTRLLSASLPQQHGGIGNPFTIWTGARSSTEKIIRTNLEKTGTRTVVCIFCRWYIGLFIVQNHLKMSKVPPEQKICEFLEQNIFWWIRDFQLVVCISLIKGKVLMIFILLHGLSDMVGIWFIWRSGIWATETLWDFEDTCFGQISCCLHKRTEIRWVAKPWCWLWKSLETLKNFLEVFPSH